MQRLLTPDSAIKIEYTTPKNLTQYEKKVFSAYINSIANASYCIPEKNNTVKKHIYSAIIKPDLEKNAYRQFIRLFSASYLNEYLRKGGTSDACH